MTMKSLYPFIFLLIFLLSCKIKAYDVEMERVLTLAGDNRSELDEVIQHYSKSDKDSLKLNATYFLILNMPQHFTTNSEQLKEFDQIFDSIASIPTGYIYKCKDPRSTKYINYKTRFIKTEKIWNRFQDRLGKPSEFELFDLPDCQYISSDLIIENIDLAFKAWAFPWARHLTFQQFCEYVLPYRFNNEPLESWRPFFMQKYSWVIDSLKDKNDPVEVCRLINNDIGSWFSFEGGFKGYPRDFSASQLMKFKMGPCLMQASLASFAMRSMGLAIAHETILQWGHRSLGHDFNAVIDKNGEFVDFLGGEHAPGQNVKSQVPKVFRRLFSIQDNLLADTSQNTPEKLSSVRLHDVTDYYQPVTDVTLSVSNTLKQRFAYLCVFNNKEWEAVYYAEIKNSQATFKRMGRGILYLPAYYYQGNYVPAGNPFILTSDGIVKTIAPSENKQLSVTLTRKYPYQDRMIKFANAMIGARFQGADNPDFINAKDIFKVSIPPDHFFKEYPIKNQSFRYVRYVFPVSSSDSIVSGDVSEVGFVGIGEDGKEKQLRGELIGASGITEFQKQLLFDEKLDNYYLIIEADTIVDDYPKHVITIPSLRQLWVGYDLGKSHTLTKVAYCPRNDLNNLYERCEYELFYWDNEWISLGRKNAKDFKLEYSNVPDGALLLLHNRTEGNEERIFTYEQGKQIWW
jgi:hypothetical protein